jgi:hypothetical protein
MRPFFVTVESIYKCKCLMLKWLYFYKIGTIQEKRRGKRNGLSLEFLLALSEDRLIRIAGAERPGFGQKALSRCCIAFGREKEVDRHTSEMRRRKKATKIDG